MEDFLAELGSLGLTLRLRRLSDRLAEDGRRLYGSLGVPLEPDWFACLLLLERRQPLSVTELAAGLRVRHPTAIELCRRLERRGLIVARPDPSDGRRRLLSLSPRARQEMPAFERLWQAFRGAIDEAAGGEAGVILALLERLETQLEHRGLDDRVRERLGRPPSADPPKCSVPRLQPGAVADDGREEPLLIARHADRASEPDAGLSPAARPRR